MTRRKAGARRSPGALGSAEQLPSGRWRAFYRRDGRKFAAPHTFATKGEADAWVAMEHADRARGVWIDPEAGRVTLEEYSRAWLDSRPDLAARSRDNYERNLRRWITPRVGAIDGARGVELGSMAVADISPAVVRAWYAAIYRHAKVSAAARVSREQRSTHPARAWARSQGVSIAATGRISPAVMEAWQQAGSPIAARVDRIGVVPVESAGETTAAQAYRALRAILATAVLDGLMASNPCQIKGAGVTHHRERSTATPAEVEALATHMPARFAMAVRLAAWSGLRFGELFALARRHVDADAGTLRVERALEQVPGQPVSFGKPKTDKSRRTVALPAFLLPGLREHLDEWVAPGADALLFTMPGGGLVTTARLSLSYRRARTVIGREDLRWHDLRHTGATLAYRAGASMPEVMRRLGHTTPRAAAIYAHAVDDSDRVLAERLNAMFAPHDPRTLRAVGGQE